MRRAHRRSDGEADSPRFREFIVMGVLMIPGQTVVTPMRCRRISSRSASENPKTANLVALYAPSMGLARIPADDETLTTCPP